MPRPALLARITDWFASWLSAAMRRVTRANAVLRRRLAWLTVKLEAADKDRVRLNETIADLREQVRSKDSELAIQTDEIEHLAEWRMREIEYQKSEKAAFTRRRVAGQRDQDEE